MSNRLAFQTQLASIMEVLANAAVAEICKLVDDDYAVVSLQMSQCQRENRALKRKLHLLELKMARGHAERRLALGGGGGGRPRVNVNHTPAERFRVTSGVSSGAVFDSQVDMGLWPGEAPSGERSEELTHPSTGQDNSPDVELVEPQVAMVKEEGQETEAELDDDVHLIGEDGVAEHVPRGAPPQPPLPRLQPNGTRPPGAPGNSSSTRGAEVSGSSSSSPPPPPPLKAELGAARGGGGCLLQAPPPPQGFDDAFCNGGGGAPLFVGGVYVGSAEPRRSSCSSSSSSYPPSGPPALPSTSSSSGGWPRAELSGFSPPAKLPPPPVARERLFVCSYCGKAFNRPKKVEIHQRIHTGERPFRCPTCGKRFSEAGNLKKHQRVHTGERPYYCRLCGKGFAWVRNLKTHQQKNHPDAYVEEDEAGGAGGPLAEQGWPSS